MKNLKFLQNLLVIFLLVIFTASLNAQPKKIKRLEQKALNLFQQKKYNDALQLYLILDSLAEDPAEFDYMIGMCYLSSPNKGNALPYLESAKNSNHASFVVYYYLGRSYHLAHNFDHAIKNYQTYKDSLSTIKIKFKKTKNFREINRVHMEKSIDDVNRLIEMCLNGMKLMEDQKEVSLVSFGGVVKSAINQKSLMVSEDGEVLTFNSHHSGMLNPTPVTSRLWKPGSSYTSANNTFIFISEKKGGFGGKDIYVSKRLADGSWSEPENMGLNINSPEDEDAPFISPDGKSLYFISRGHNSMGGFDIFKCVFQENTKTWGKPENLGYPLNTADNDLYLIKSQEMKIGYYSPK